MKLLLTIALTIFSLKAGAAASDDCDFWYNIDSSSKKEAEVPYFILEPLQSVKLCMRLPKVDFSDPKNARQSPYIEFYTINLGNASCSGVHFTVNPPGGDASQTYRGRNMDPAPGAVMKYKPGLWIVKYELQWGCNKYRAMASWSVTP